MSHTSTPTPGLWLRVEPGGKAVAVEMDLAPTLGWFDYRADKGGWLEDDQPGTLYYPISVEIFEAAERMADAIERVDFAARLSAMYTYRAAVAKAVGEGWRTIAKNLRKYM